MDGRGGTHFRQIGVTPFSIATVPKPDFLEFLQVRQFALPHNKCRSPG